MRRSWKETGLLVLSLLGAQTMPASNSFTRPQSVDTLIIGGGSIGVCSAYYLTEKNRQVVLLDQGEIAAGSSYGNAGLIVPSHSVPLAAPGVMSKALKWMWNGESPLYIKPRLNLEMASWLLKFRAACSKNHMEKNIPLLRDLGLASRKLHEELAGGLGIDYSFERNGVLFLFRSRHELEGGIHESNLLREYGISSKTLGEAEVRQLVPNARPGTFGGIFYDQDAHLDPAQFVQGLGKHLCEKGVDVRTSTEVLGFETTNGQVALVTTTRGDFRPEQIILATGAWTPILARDLRLELPIQAGKGYSITVKRPANWPSVPLMLTERKVGATPMGPRLRFAGTLEFAGLDFSINKRRVQAILRAAREYLSDTEELELIEIWRGLRPCTPDGLPMIGRSSSFNNLIIAAGHGMLGVSLGPITGKLVSQLVCGETPSLNLSGLKPERFN